MSKTAIEQIRETEEQAAILCRVAEEKATEMRERVKAEGEAHCAAVRENTEAEYAEMLADIRQRAAALEQKKRREAMAEAEAMRETAIEHIGEAVRMIVWEIVENVSK
ncbi:MAG: hypothetical protein IKM08_05770 [Clostridia bacterium]|nr:hypothetical protein [Oscillospiraceae bacterium]MBR6727681.1 hypothetical protein [Clostridia bacterium]